MINKVMLIGRLGKDPELKYTQTQQSVAKFPLAVSEKWKDKQGQMQERIEWCNVVVWGPQAENCQKYLKKGSQAFVEGKLQTRNYEDKKGETKYITEVVASAVRFLDSAPKTRDEPQHEPQQAEMDYPPEPGMFG